MIFEMSQVLTEKVWPPYEIQVITTVDSVTRLRWGLISVFNVPTPHRGERGVSTDFQFAALPFINFAVG